MNHSLNTFPRRKFLQGAGVALSLPMLDALLPKARGEDAPPSGKKMVCICTSLGLHAPFLFPNETGADYAPTPYLELLKEHRADFTLFSGLSHPDQTGANGHTSEMTWLTSARHPGLGGFRNTVSLDQLAAEKIGLQTRYPSLVLGTGSPSLSYTRGGVMIPAESRPSRVFAKLFLDGTPDDVKRQLQKLREGQSIMDTVRDEARSFTRRVGAADRDKLDEYFTSVRELEQRLVKSEAWVQKPKPKIDAEPPRDITNGSDLIGRMQLLFDLIPLALQTDSTRLITIFLQGANAVPPVSGVTIDHHNLSHHGQEPDKIAQLRLIETEQFRVFSSLIDKLRKKQEKGKSLLDDTMVLFGSNLGNANSHDTRNLPILLAGGGFKLGQHTAFDPNKNAPLCNLYVSMLKQLGIETDAFGSSTGTLTGMSPT
ncbi:MAG: hypothetical protein ACI9R3_003822 [Verrucomicrobiales bacterium]|jgi:hypothetical protein